MSTVDTTGHLDLLRKWQTRRLEQLGAHPVFSNVGPFSVTILCYFYRPANQIADKFPFTRCAIFETWRHCGIMKTVLVVNELNKEVEQFRDIYPDWVSVQVEPTLTPGNVDAMSIDCNSKLYTRFQTPYVLIVQDDGFPLRPGLERFIGKADFLGSPFRRRNLKGYFASVLMRHCPANGGFSLRTQKICRLAAKYWNEYYRYTPFTPEQVEDIFYTDTLPKRFFPYRLATHIANSRIASDFCYDGCLPENITSSPFGFHSARAFEILLNMRNTR